MMTKEEYEQIRKTFIEEYINKKHTKEVLTVENDLENQIREYPLGNDLFYEDKFFVNKLFSIDIENILRRDYPFLDFEVEFEFRSYHCPQTCRVCWCGKDDE